MWITHKTKDGDTLQSIMKRYKIKDQNVILRLPQNKSVAPLLKKGQALKRGTSVRVPDPNAKVYVIKTPKGESVVDEKGYQQYLKGINQTLDRGLDQIKIAYKTTADRHSEQLRLRKEHWFVSSIIETYSSIPPEPAAQGKKAGASFIKLSRATQARNYKEVAKLTPVAEKDLRAYQKALEAWIDAITGSGEKFVTRLEVVRDVCAAANAAIAVTITAPVGLGWTLLAGAAASGGVGLAYDGGEQIGRAAAGMKLLSAGEIGSRLLANATVGAVGAGLSKTVVAAANKMFVQRILTKQVVSRWAASALNRRIVQSIVETEARAGTRVASEVVVTALVKFMARLGVAELMKHTGASKPVKAAIDSWLRSNPKALQAKDAKSVGNAAADALSKAGVADTIFDEILKARAEDFRKELRAEIQRRS
jgi:phage tail protein X